jgi:hypothetical protein
MTIRLNPRWLLISVLLFSLQFCRAQTEIPPSLSFSLGPSVAAETQLWDLTGDYNVLLEVTDHNGLAVPVNISFSLRQDTSGKLSGPVGNISGVVFNNDDNSAFAITAKIAGKVTGSGGLARAHFTVHFKGNGSFGGLQNVAINGSLTVDGETDPSSGQLVGTRISKFTAKIGGGLNHITGKSDFAAGLPTDGSWNLTLNVAGLTKFTGTGIVGLPSQTLGLDLVGNFRGGLIRLNAKGASNVVNTQPGQGLSAKIFLTPSFDTLQLNGKLMGQRMSFNVGTSPE